MLNEFLTNYYYAVSFPTRFKRLYLPPNVNQLVQPRRLSSTLIDKQEAISKKINKINPMIKRASWMKKLVLKILWIKRNVNYGQ